MNNHFLVSYNKTNGHEGLYSNHPSDRGGETWKGIARKFHSNWGGWSVIDSYKGKSGFPSILNRITKLNEMHKDFFYKNFWLAINLDKISNIDPSISNKLYDIGVNMGTKQAALILQRALNICNRNGKDYKDIAVDGVIGNATMSALSSNRNKDVLYKVIDTLQAYRYISIAEANKSQEAFIHGWFANRVRP